MLARHRRSPSRICRRHPTVLGSPPTSPQQRVRPFFIAAAGLSFLECFLTFPLPLCGFGCLLLYRPFSLGSFKFRPHRCEVASGDELGTAGCTACLPLLEKGLLVAHQFCLLMAHYWCATSTTPLEYFSNGTPQVRH